MAKRSGNELLLHDRVVSTVDLPGIPAGTPGKVILKNGFDWVRYRVLFETDAPNGSDVGSLQRDTLQRIDKHGNPIPEAEGANS
ncbi:MAG: hypothetical protein U0Q22_16245 [Acidimicrobiales bacterium]